MRVSSCHSEPKPRANCGRFSRVVLERPWKKAMREICLGTLKSFIQWHLGQERSRDGRRRRGTKMASSLHTFYNTFRLVYRRALLAEPDHKIERNAAVNVCHPPGALPSAASRPLGLQRIILGHRRIQGGVVKREEGQPPDDAGRIEIADRNDTEHHREGFQIRGAAGVGGVVSPPACTGRITPRFDSEAPVQTHPDRSPPAPGRTGAVGHLHETGVHENI